LVLFASLRVTFLIHLTTRLDDAKCYEIVRGLRWPDGVRCPQCGALSMSKQGRDARQQARQDDRCGDYGRYFDDLAGTIFAGRYQRLEIWIGCMYLMGLNLSNLQIAHELGLSEDDAQRMTTPLRTDIVASEPTPRLSGEVECDEVYVVAGHKGYPEAVEKKA
jgi:transposase-like protein